MCLAESYRMLHFCTAAQSTWVVRVTLQQQSHPQPQDVRVCWGVQCCQHALRSRKTSAVMLEVVLQLFVRVS
jgi:hypothetical protein